MEARTGFERGSKGGYNGMRTGLWSPEMGESDMADGEVSDGSESCGGEWGDSGQSDDISVESEGFRSPGFVWIMFEGPGWPSLLLDGRGRSRAAPVHASLRCDHVRSPAFHCISSCNSRLLFRRLSCTLAAIASGLSNRYGSRLSTAATIASPTGSSESAPKSEEPSSLYL